MTRLFFDDKEIEKEDVNNYFNLCEERDLDFDDIYSEKVTSDQFEGVWPKQRIRKFTTIPKKYKNCVTNLTAGSVGQPRDRDPRAAYVEFDTETAYIRFIRVAYDIATAANKIKNQPELSNVLANRLEYGV